jgi:hypothetical protein
MDKLLLRGEQLKAVSCGFSVSEDTLQRHKGPIEVVVAKAAALVDQKDVARISRSPTCVL